MLSLMPAFSAHVLSTSSRYLVGSRATPTTMFVESWYDQGVRLSPSEEVEVIETSLPAGMSASAAATSPQLRVKALTYEADIAKTQARLASSRRPDLGISSRSWPKRSLSFSSPSALPRGYLAAAQSSRWSCRFA